MPTLSVTYKFIAYRHNAPPITDEEFLVPLALAPGEVEAAWSWKERWGGAGVRITTARSEHPVADAEFDRWAADASHAVVRFLDDRPPGAFERLRAAGLVNIHLLADVVYVGDFPIVDWPEDLYTAVQRHGIGFGSMWELPEEHDPDVPSVVTDC